MIVEGRLPVNAAEALGIDQRFRHGGGSGMISITQFLIDLWALQCFVCAHLQLPGYLGTLRGHG